jgi:putative hydroxymethylpyrimidine transport system substrate-binding protein
MRLRFRLAAALAVPLAAVVAATSLALPAQAADKLTVILDWYVNPDHAPLVVAQEGGYFARHGLDVDLIVSPDASAPPKLVAAGQAEIAITYQSDLMLQVKEGLPVVRFGTLVNTPLNCLIALKDGPIKSLADLKGRTVGYSIASFEDAYLNAILGSVGLSVDDVTTVNLNFNLVPPLIAGQVDAILGGYRNVEFVQLELDGYPANAWFPEEHGVPAYDELIYVTRDALRDDPRLPRFLAAIQEATAFLDTHTDEALQMFIKSHTDLDDELNRRSFAATLPLFARDPATLDVARYETFAAFLKEKGLLEEVPPLATFAIELTPAE